MAKQQQTAAANGQHPMREFTAGGKIYRRRADIMMAEWLARLRDMREQGYTIFAEAYWTALLLGRLEPDTMALPAEERMKLGEDAIADIPVSEYMALRDALIEDIQMPATPESEKKDAAPSPA